MRKSERIDKFLEEFGKEWKKVPDWRFGQFISNVLGEIVATTGVDIFFPEEDEMIKLIREAMKKFAP